MQNKKKVVIVDDAFPVAAMASDVLKHMGLEVDFYTDPREFVRHMKTDLKSRKYDLILLDWNMPEMSGMGVLNLLKSSPLTDGIPVVMFTSNKHKLEIKQALEAGAEGYITKPFKPQDLMKQINNIMTKIEKRASGKLTDDESGKNSSAHDGDIEIDFL